MFFHFKIRGSLNAAESRLCCWPDTGSQISRNRLKITARGNSTFQTFQVLTVWTQLLHPFLGSLSRVMSERTRTQQHKHSRYIGSRVFLSKHSLLVWSPLLRTCTLLHLVPLYLTSFPLFFSASMRTSKSLSDSIQTSFFGRSISNVSTDGTNNSCFTENRWWTFYQQTYDLQSFLNDCFVHTCESNRAYSLWSGSVR